MYPWPTHVDAWRKPSQCCNYPLIKNKNEKTRVTGSSLSSVTLLFQGLLLWTVLCAKDDWWAVGHSGHSLSCTRTWTVLCVRMTDGQWGTVGIPCPAHAPAPFALGPGSAVSMGSVMPLEGLPADASQKPALLWAAPPSRATLGKSECRSPPGLPELTAGKAAIGDGKKDLRLETGKERWTPGRECFPWMSLNNVFIDCFQKNEL